MHDASVEIPEHLRPWLYDSGSLTRSVQAACTRGFGMRVLAQQDALPSAEDAAVLGIEENTEVILREVHLLCGDTAWVYARSIIPHSSLSGEQAYLGKMGEQPLGAALFADPSMQRGALEIVQLSADARIADGQTVAGGYLWGRRSVFQVGGKPLLVAEYFLPAIAAYPQIRS